MIGITSVISIVGSAAAAWLTGIVGPDRTAALDLARKTELSETANSFQQRRVAAVKERLKSKASATSKATTAGLFDRPAAMEAVAVIAEKAGLYMVCGPKGEGKSSLMELLEAQHPFVIRVNLQKGSMDKAVRAVAAAIGYSLDYSPAELAAKQAEFKVPDISAKLGVTDLEDLLLVYEQACKELHAEGAFASKKPGEDVHVPVLILE